MVGSAVSSTVWCGVVVATTIKFVVIPGARRARGAQLHFFSFHFGGQPLRLLHFTPSRVVVGEGGEVLVEVPLRSDRLSRLGQVDAGIHLCRRLGLEELRHQRSLLISQGEFLVLQRRSSNLALCG